MELKDFVSSVLVSLVRGVEEAQEQLQGSKAIINPLGLKAQLALEQNKETAQFTDVEFEVAVTAESST